MHCADALIARIAASSGIPSRKRREEIARELRAHVEDFASSARLEGHGEGEIERMVLASFDHPARFAANFAWVYRRERAMVRLAIFGLGTVATAAAVSAVVFAMQAGAALGFGRAPAEVLASRHTAIEATDILATVAAYVGLLSLENFFQSRRLPKSMAVLVSISVVLACAFALAGERAIFLIFGCANAIFLRSLEEFLVSGKSRLVAATAYFGLFGAFFFAVLPRSSVSLSAWLVSWAIMGVGYHLMTLIGAFIGRELSGRLPQP
jgi:hypothetical protein